MKVDVDMIKKLELLCALDITDKEGFASDIEKVLNYSEMLNELLPDETEQKSSQDLRQRSCPEREDQVVRGFTPEQALKNAPDAVGRSFRMPRIVD